MLKSRMDRSFQPRAPVGSDELPTDSEELPVDSQALIALFEGEESRLLRLAYALTHRRSIAEEIVQEVFLRLHYHWDSVRAPRPWLHRAVRNLALDHINRDKREKNGLGPKDLEAMSLEMITRKTDGETASKSLDTKETADELQTHLRQLSEIDQELITLRYFQNKSYRQMSEQTGLSVSNVGFRLHKAILKLADRYRNDGEDCHE